MHHRSSTTAAGDAARAHVLSSASRWLRLLALVVCSLACLQTTPVAAQNATSVPAPPPPTSMPAVATPPTNNSLTAGTPVPRDESDRNRDEFTQEYLIIVLAGGGGLLLVGIGCCCVFCRGDKAAAGDSMKRKTSSGKYVSDTSSESARSDATVPASVTLRKNSTGGSGKASGKPATAPRESVEPLEPSTSSSTEPKPAWSSGGMVMATSPEPSTLDKPVQKSTSVVHGFDSPDAEDL